MKRVIKIKNAYGTEDKYVFSEEYMGFGIYERMTPNGYKVHQSWLISNNEDAQLIIDSFNKMCKEELLDMIDNYNETGKYGVKCLVSYGGLCVHPSGKKM